MKKIIFSLSLGFSIFSTSLFAQLTQYPFSYTSAFRGSVRAIDIDNDGKLDVVAVGANNLGGVETAVVKNDGAIFDAGWSTFSGMTSKGNGEKPDAVYPVSGLPKFLWWADMKTGDIDNDGFTDVFITGGEYTMSAPFFNEAGSFAFQWKPIGFEPTVELIGQSGLADFNNDGNLDFVCVGGFFGGTTYDRTAIFYGDGNGGTRRVPLVIPNNSSMEKPELKVADVNSDGFADIWVTGWNVNWDNRIFYSYVLLNNGDETFTTMSSSSIGIAERGWSSSDWGDFNADGLPDLVIMGDGGGDDFAVRIYKNNGSSALASEYATIYGYYPKSVGGGCRFIDIDNDGDLDLIITGLLQSENRAVTHLYLNNGTTFVKSDAMDGFLGFVEGAMEFVDIDNNGTLDILQTGLNSISSPFAAVAAITDNEMMTPNAAPSAPTNLRVVKDGNKYTFSWDASSDDKTPTVALSYNLFIRDKATGKLIVTPQADLATGKRRINEIGNVGQRLSKIYTLNIADESTIEWGVQAIDMVYSGSVFSKLDLLKTSLNLNSQDNIKIIQTRNKINFTGISSGKVIIFSIDGSTLGEYHYNGTAIKTDKLRSGVYIVNLETENGNKVFRIRN